MGGIELGKARIRVVGKETEGMGDKMHICARKPNKSKHD